MSAVEPLFSHHAASDVLKNLFSPSSATNAASEFKIPQPEQAIAAKDASIANTVEDTFARAAKKASSLASAEVGETTESGEQDLLQAEAKEISAEPNDNVHVDHFITQPEQSEEPINLTKSDLVRVLETFVSVLMENNHQPGSEGQGESGAHINLPSPIPFEPSQHALGEMHQIIDAKNDEIDELKTLLVEAQSTIITLLTDRVEDKAKIATFETQMRYLPDYQRLHTPPGEVSGPESEELRADLTKVKAELQNIKMTAYKTGFDNTAPKWAGFKSWLAKIMG